MRAPILAYRDAAGDLMVTMGQIRTLAAIEAGTEEVPVWVQPPPVDDEKAATIGRLGENDHSTGMTRGDVYEAHKQLSLLGLSATAIARRRSRPKRVIEDSLRVGDSELASKAGDKYHPGEPGSVRWVTHRRSRPTGSKWLGQQQLVNPRTSRHMGTHPPH